MVAGMLMSLADLRAIYELLFRDGLIVAKKDKRPQSMHPDIKLVSNLKVLCAVGSLKSKGYVRETFAWKHAYYYLTNEGTEYLRNYLHLPQDVMPAPLQHVHCPASSARAQTVKGPSSYVPKLRKDTGRIVKQRESAWSEAIKEGKDGGKKGHKKGSRAPSFFAEEKPTSSFTSVMETKSLLSCVHNSSSVVPEIPKEMSTIQTAPYGPVNIVLPNCLKVTAAEQPSSFEESESAQMQKATIEIVMGGKTFNPAFNVPGEVETSQQEVENQQTIPLLTQLSVEEEPQGICEGDDVVIEEAVEKLSYDADMTEQLNVTNSKTPESNCDRDLATHKALTKDKVVDNDMADVEHTQKVLEKTVVTEVISQLHVASETSTSATYRDCLIPVDPSEYVLKALLLQGDLESLTEVPEKRQDFHRIWPDFQEGLNLSLFSPSSSVSSSFFLSAS